MFICVFLVNNNTVSERDKALFSFSSQLAISFGGDLFTLVEDESMGITFSNLTMKVENYRISTAYLMTLANILIFFGNAALPPIISRQRSRQRSRHQRSRQFRLLRQPGRASLAAGPSLFKSP